MAKDFLQDLQVIKAEWSLDFIFLPQPQRNLFNGYTTGVDYLTYRQFITDISVEQVAEGSDTMTIKVKDANLIFLNNEALFTDEARINFFVRWNNSTNAYRFDGIVSAIDIDFTEEGIPFLTITCLDYATHLMNREKKKRTWENSTIADIARDIVSKYGVINKVEIEDYDYIVYPSISQSDQTDIEFLEDLAKKEREAFICTVTMDKSGNLGMNDVTKFILKRKNFEEVNDVNKIFTYRENDFSIISFSPRINKETKKIEVKKEDINTDTKKVDVGVASNNTTPREIEKGATPVGEESVTYSRNTGGVVNA